MNALILAIKKLLAVIISVFVPVTSTAPIAAPRVVHYSNANVVVVEQTSENSDAQYEIKEDPKTEDETPNETQNEPSAQQEINNDDNGFVPVQVWDVSATENDNVTMAFYDTEDTEALLAQLAGRITALFAPMTAYADENDPSTFEDEDEANKGASLEFLENGGSLTPSSENGIARHAYDPRSFLAGTVVVYGEGEMQDYVYENFMSIERYKAAVTAMLSEYYPNREIIAEYPEDENITDVIEFDARTKWRLDDTGEYIEITEEMKESLNPVSFLDKVPKHLVIDEGVTNISNYAFTLCAEIEELELPSTIEKIGSNAFAYCRGLTTIDLRNNGDLKEIGAAAFEHCSNVTEVFLPKNVKNIAILAFNNLAEGSIIYCPNYAVYWLFAVDGLYNERRTDVFPPDPFM